MAQLTIPGGKEKGKQLVDASEDTLRWWQDKIAGDLAENPNKNYADRDRALVEGMRAELVRRGADAKDFGKLPSGNGGGAAQGAQGGAFRAKPPAPAPPAQGASPKPPTAPTTALAARPQEQLVATRDIHTVNAQLEDFASKCILVSPATSCAALPEGCEVAFSLLRVDPNPEKDGPGDVVKMPGGKLALSGTVLKKIAAAAGVDWDPRQSGRLDNGSDPNYCHYRAVGIVRGFDGSVRHVIGEVELDLRDGSSQIEAMYARATSDASKVDNQIRDMRLFLVRHAETKAKLRAVTDLGLKRSYTKEELAKPFAVPRLMFTGRSENPQIAMMMAEKIADAHTASIRGLYGAPAALPAPRQVHQAPPAHHAPAYAPPQFGGHVPPPVGSVIDQDDIPPAKPTPRPEPQAQGQQPPDDGDYDNDPSLEGDIPT